MSVLLLDADGVVLKKGEYFSERFSREYSVPLNEVLVFFKNVYGDCQAGTKDLKQELIPYLRQWNWEGSVDDFLDYWFEDIEINPETVETIAEFKQRGIPVYLASNNEHYRARAIEQALGNTLDGYFFSADLKVKKSNSEYFDTVAKALGVETADMHFVDNDERNINAAIEAGVNARLFSEGTLKELLAENRLSEFKIKNQ
jgi:putative hydrolase of the HAD superfamily